MLIFSRSSYILDSLRWGQNLDLLIVGFWGHGVVLNGERYLCPITAKSAQLRETAVALSDVLEAVGISLPKIWALF
ncbi:MAG: hypothetical protein Q4D38_06775 [Planctomycetia bacterium]|nr:hypothetical protein [Planctomycetia bacterium]